MQLHISYLSTRRGLLLGLLLFFSASLAHAFERDKAVTVAVLAINDFHAAFLPDSAQGIPGAANLWYCIDSLRQQYPNHIVVSGGDNFGGSYFSRKTHDAYLPWFFAQLGITLSAVGNHEFDNGVPFLADRWQSCTTDKPQDWALTYACANVTDAQGHIPTFMQPIVLRSIPIVGSHDTVRIAFTGLLTATTPQQTAAKNVQGLHFDTNYTQVLRSLEVNPSTQALLQRANIRLLVMHIGTVMQQGKPIWSLPSDVQHFAGLEELHYQGILSAHSHQWVQGTLQGLPTVQAASYGRGVSLLRFLVDTTTHEVQAMPPLVVPVSLHSGTNEHKRAIALRVDSILAHTSDGTGHTLGTVLTQSLSTVIHDRDNKGHITQLGGMVCASYAEAARHALHLSLHTPVIGICHMGGIRSNLEAGPVRIIEAGQVLPFANQVAVFRMSGRMLKSLLQFGINNLQYGFLQSSYLTIYANRTLRSPGQPPYNTIQKVMYTNPTTGKRIRIKDDQTYYVAADDFMTHGGDGYDTRYFDSTRLKADLPVTAEAFFAYLKERKVIGGNTHSQASRIVWR